MSGSVSSAEGELNAIIKEYLESLKLGGTLVAFEEECRKKGKPIQDHAGQHDEKILKIQKELIHNFNEGERIEFFTFWEANISINDVDQDSYSRKLEFMLQIYFAIYPLRKPDHWVQEDIEQAMYQFRYYLENRGACLSGCSDLLPYFALPYVQHHALYTHQSFSHIFKDSWVIDLRNKLETFLWETLKNKFIENTTVPRLVDLYNHNDFDLKETKSELLILERQLEDSQKCYVYQAKKLDKLQTDCQQLMSTASLLVTALESAVKGDIVDLDCVLSSCAESLPEVFKSKSTDQATLSAEKKEQQLVISCHLQSYDETNCNTIPPSEFVLNFKKIRRDMCGDDERKQLLLLQALRWRLTKMDSWIMKEKILINFIENDIFNLREVSSKQMNFIDTMRTFNVFLRQSISRILNTFASFSKGREYLSRCPEVLHALMDNLLVFKSKDNIIRDMTLGTLQKLSMRSVCQILMVEAGMMEWLTETLYKSKQLSDYALEYSVALLMNLCLCPMGKPRCEAIKEKLLLLLQNLLLLDNKNIVGYVNGALYSILSIPSIKCFALDQNLEITLLKVKKKSDLEVQKQLECIQDLLHAEIENSPCSSAEDTADEEDTELEPELDLHDPVSPFPGESSGEILLWKVYSLFNLAETSPVRNKEANTKYSEQRHERLIKNLTVDDCSIVQNVSNNGSSLADLRSNSVPAIPQIPPESLPELLSPSKIAPVSEPVTPKLDLEATQLVRKIVGDSASSLVEAVVIAPSPSLVNTKGLNVNEYFCAFSSRPKIPRTPELSPTVSKRRASSNIDTPCLDDNDFD